MESRPDLNLLVALDVLLAEGSVAAAGRRMKLSASAMSRTLSRLREATGDPLLVRAGRGLVATPRALELRARVGTLVDEAEATLRPAASVDLQTLRRTFTLRSSDGFVDTFGPVLVGRAQREAPNVRLRFIQKTDKESSLLRSGAVDLETGVVDDETSPEVRTQLLFRDRFVAVTAPQHRLHRGRLTTQRYEEARHVTVSRRAVDDGPLARAVLAAGVKRDVAVIVGGFAAALALVRGTDLVATVPDRHTRGLRGDLHTAKLPFLSPEFTVSMLWHPRLDADPAHRWLRACVKAACGEQRS